jgi:hypothetical protein
MRLAVHNFSGHHSRRLEVCYVCGAHPIISSPQCVSIIT